GLYHLIYSHTFLFFIDPATTVNYTLSLHDALPIYHHPHLSLYRVIVHNFFPLSDSNPGLYSPKKFGAKLNNQNPPHHSYLIVSKTIKLFLMMFTHSFICSAEMINGGANLILSPCVGLAIKPASFN